LKNAPFLAAFVIKIVIGGHEIDKGQQQEWQQAKYEGSPQNVISSPAGW
jgi:hypothetical protein